MMEDTKQPSLPYREGSWFAVPIWGGGYNVGVVARLAPPIIFAYFFGHKYSTVPKLRDLVGLKPSHATRKLRVGDLGLVNGEWPILGFLDGWQREKWPMPEFIRRAPFSARAWRVTYEDSKPDEPARKDTCILDTTGQQLENDALYGYGSVERTLSFRRPRSPGR